MNKPAKISFRGFLSAKTEKLFKSKSFHSFLKMAEDSQNVFGALYAAALACFLRPAAIVATPGKKNKDDKKYAAAHSIASGAIGFFVSLLIGSPITSAFKKIEKEPGKYLKMNKEILNGKGMSITNKYINMVPEAAFAPLKVMITIAIIPPILKYVFRLEKKHSKDQKADLNMLQNPAMINFKSTNAKARKAFHSFTGEIK